MLFSAEPATCDEPIEASDEGKGQLAKKTPVIHGRLSYIECSPAGHPEKSSYTITAISQSGSKKACGPWNRARSEKIRLEEGPFSISKP
jgi:hypothetical protein